MKQFKVTEESWKFVRELISAGLTRKQISSVVKCSLGTVRNVEKYGSYQEYQAFREEIRLKSTAEQPKPVLEESDKPEQTDPDITTAFKELSNAFFELAAVLEKLSA